MERKVDNKKEYYLKMIENLEKDKKKSQKIELEKKIKEEKIKVMEMKMEAEKLKNKRRGRPKKQQEEILKEDSAEEVPDVQNKNQQIINNFFDKNAIYPGDVDEIQKLRDIIQKQQQEIKQKDQIIEKLAKHVKYQVAVASSFEQTVFDHCYSQQRENYEMEEYLRDVLNIE